MPDWEDECEGDDGDGTEVSIFGIGLDDNDEICIAAVVDNIGYGHGPYDFPQEWTKATELYEPDYCAFHRFVADNIDKAQGSGYEAILIFLPENINNPLLNRQILYTALTRTKGSTYLLANENILKQAVEREIVRTTMIQFNGNKNQ